MNGPEHYQKAEMFLAEAAKPVGMDTERYALAMAQVHATLALAAAAVDAGHERMDAVDGGRWRAAGVTS